MKRAINISKTLAKLIDLNKPKTKKKPRLIKVAFSELYKLKTYDLSEDRHLGVLYYKVPGYGIVELNDLATLKCADLESTHILNALISYLISSAKVNTPKYKSPLTPVMVRWKICYE